MQGLAPRGRGNFLPKAGSWGGATQKVHQAWLSHFQWTEGVNVAFCPSLFGPLFQDLFPRAFFVLCVGVSFRCCPGPLKYHDPFPMQQGERWKMPPPPLLSRMSRGESAPAGGKFVFLADETFANEKNCPPMKHCCQ